MNFVKTKVTCDKWLKGHKKEALVKNKVKRQRRSKNLSASCSEEKVTMKMCNSTYDFIVQRKGNYICM